MRFIFIVQGEGRGHMTQAIAMYQLLSSRGHEVSDVLIGSSERREVPRYVTEQIAANIHSIASPNFVTDAQQKSVNIRATLVNNLLRINTFQKSLRQLDRLVKEKSPDVVLNFYDFLGGIWFGLYRPTLSYVVVGHQYLISHPAFPFARGTRWDKMLLQLGSLLTAWGADMRIALSFRALPQVEEEPGLKIWPPLLREQLKQVTVSRGDFILGYVVNPGYGEELLQFAKDNPGIAIEAFWDQKGKENPWQPLPNLLFHQLNGSLFLEKMGQCKGMVSTAGFESICEAMYLGKPVMMVPVKGQYEQACNALDGELAGAGIAMTSFDIETLFNLANDFPMDGHKKFIDWYAERDKLVDDWLLELNLKNNVLDTVAVPR